MSGNSNRNLRMRYIAEHNDTRTRDKRLKRAVYRVCRLWKLFFSLLPFIMFDGSVRCGTAGVKNYCVAQRAHMLTQTFKIIRVIRTLIADEIGTTEKT